MKHSFTSVRLLEIRHGHEYEITSAVVFTLISLSLQRFQPLLLTFGSNPLSGFIFVNALSAYQNIGGFIGAASVEPPAVSSAI